MLLIRPGTTLEPCTSGKFQQSWLLLFGMHEKSFKGLLVVFIHPDMTYFKSIIFAAISWSMSSEASMQKLTRSCHVQMRIARGAVHKHWDVEPI